METYLIKRYDILTETVNSIKSFNEHESNIIDKIIKPHTNMTDKEIKKSLDTQETFIKQYMLMKPPEINSSQLYL